MEAEIKRLSNELTAKQQESQRKYVGGTFLWPVDIKHNGISSYFGPRKSPITGKPEHHNSIDIPAPYGSNIYAVNDGTVILSNYSNGYGNTIVVDHGGGKTTRYSHNSLNLKKVGDKVKKGDVIAKIGSTGWSTGNHLDFGYLENGVPKNPLTNGLVKP
jgi:murein DD-endopeptidase MepM/ murein hydrolase activator NlpD